MTRAWQTVIGLTVSLLLLYWALHDVSFSELWGYLRDANFGLLLLAIAMQTSLFLVRAARWKVFLKPALERPSFYSRFASTCIGFMANNLLPARVGEFARAYALSRSQPISVSASFGSLVVERLFDGLTLVAFLAAPLFRARTLDFQVHILFHQVLSYRRPHQKTAQDNEGHNHERDLQQELSPF